MHKFADMNPGISPHDELDQLIFATLREAPDLELSQNFTDDLLIRVEKQLWWREHLQVFGIKTGIVAGTLGLILLLIVLWLRESSEPLLLWMNMHWQLLLGSGVLILFTFFLDQVLLRYFNRKVSGFRVR